MHITSTEGEQLDTVEEDKKVLKDISIYFFISPYRHVLWHNQHRANTTTTKNVYKIYFILYSFQVWRVLLCTHVELCTFAKHKSSRKHTWTCPTLHRSSPSRLVSSRNTKSIHLPVATWRQSWWGAMWSEFSCTDNDTWIATGRMMGGAFWRWSTGEPSIRKHWNKKFMLRRELWIFIVFSREFSVHVIFCRHKCGEQKLFGNVQQCRNSSQVLGVNKKMNALWKLKMTKNMKQKITRHKKYIAFSFWDIAKDIKWKNKKLYEKNNLW